MIKKAYAWMSSKVHSPRANMFLGILFFMEAIFFIPVDPILILFCFERPKRAFLYSTIATLFSVAGGVAAYYIGFAVWEAMGEKIVNFFISPETFERIARSYEANENAAVLIAGFTPIPYKAITLTAGFFKLPLIPFIVCSLISRGARFYLYAIAITIWGERMKEYIDRYFNLLVVLSLAVIVAGFWFLK